MNRGDGTASAVQEMASDGRSWLALGLVTKVEQHAVWGWLLTVTERPSGRIAQARPMFPLSGVGGSVVAAPSVNDEVVLLYPGGNANRAIALAGFPRPIPGSVLQGGAEFRVNADADVQPALRATTFQSDLNGFLTALTTFMTATSTATFAAQIAAAAGTFIADTDVLTFIARASSGFYSAEALRTE